MERERAIAAVDLDDDLLIGLDECADLSGRFLHVIANVTYRHEKRQDRNVGEIRQGRAWAKFHVGTKAAIGGNPTSPPRLARARTRGRTVNPLRLVAEHGHSLGERYPKKMDQRQAAVLLVSLFVAVAHGTQYYQERIITGGGCDSYTCGTNARCTLSEGRPVCSCLNLHMGDPLVQCTRVQCLVNEDCSSTNVCTNNRCVDPCASLCGFNALCETRDHVPRCYCPPGYTGNPNAECRVADPEAACKPNPCGSNTKCKVTNEVPVCTCLPGYTGSPLSGCRHECESDGECPGHLACSSNFRCENPCQCGTNAECKVVNHRAVCTCPNNWLGNPLLSCRPECSSHSECLSNKPACLYQKCINPCEGVCGFQADCNLRGITPVCSCPKHMTGNPFHSCRPFEDRDLCEPNPCGTNAICTPGHDNTGKERPVCTCPTGYIGNALTSCQRGECFTDSECPDNRACIDFTCQNPCTGRECGPNANCTPRRHIAVCTCPDGTRGDALFRCNTIETRFSNNLSRPNRYRY